MTNKTERAREFYKALEEDMYITSFQILMMFKNTFLKGTIYQPFLGHHGLQTVPPIHRWTKAYGHEMYYADDVMEVLTSGLKTYFNNIQSQCFLEVQEYSSGDQQHELIQKKIKKISELCILADRGELYKSLIDNYKLGYFN